MPRPSVGRIVHYFAHPSNPRELGVANVGEVGKPLAAMVSAVMPAPGTGSEAALLNVAVLDFYGQWRDRACVLFYDLAWSQAITLPNPAGSSFACWPDREQ